MSQISINATLKIHRMGENEKGWPFVQLRGWDVRESWG